MEIDEIRNRWNREAREFDAIYGSSSPIMRGVNRWLRKAVLQRFDYAIEEMIPKPGAAVLDVGCGSGVYEEALLNAGASRVVGVDVSEGMLDLARRRLATHPRGSSADFVLGDFWEWNSDEKFDFSIANGVYDYTANPKDLILRMRRFTTRRMVMSFPSHSTLRFRSSLRRARYLVQSKGDVYYYTRDEIESLARACEPVAFRLRDLGDGQGYLLVLDLDDAP